MCEHFCVENVEVIVYEDFRNEGRLLCGFQLGLCDLDAPLDGFRLVCSSRQQTLPQLVYLRRSEEYGVCLIAGFEEQLRAFYFYL